MVRELINTNSKGSLIFMLNVSKKVLGPIIDMEPKSGVTTENDIEVSEFPSTGKRGM